MTLPFRRHTFIALSLGALLSLEGCARLGLDFSFGQEKEAGPMLDLATSAEAAFDYASAVGHYRAALAGKESHRAATLGLARVLRYTGEVKEANDLMRAAVARDGADGEFQLEMGRLQVALDRHEEALGFLDRAVELRPDDWHGHSVRGIALDYLGRYDVAQQSYRRALELAPDHPTVVNNLALSLAQEGRLEEAVTTLETASRHPAATVQVRQNLALLKALQGDVAAAERGALRDLPPDMARHNAEFYRRLAEARRPRDDGLSESGPAPTARPPRRRR